MRAGHIGHVCSSPLAAGVGVLVGGTSHLEPVLQVLALFIVVPLERHPLPGGSALDGAEIDRRLLLQRKILPGF